MTKQEIYKRMDRFIESCSNEKYFITVFLRTHERPDYARIMIDCILKQTYKKFYFVIIDNESKDSTPDVIKSFLDQKILFIQWKSEYGPLVMSEIYRFVRTRYYVCFHDDDYVDEKYLETMLQIMENNLDYAFASCSCDIIDSVGNIIEKSELQDGVHTFQNDDFLINFFVNGNHKIWVPYPANMYRSSFFCRPDLYFNINAGPACDQYVCMQTERYGGTIAIVGGNLFKYRVHKNQESKIRTQMYRQLICFLFQDEYYIKKLTPKVKKLSWIIKSCIKASLIDYKNGSITKKEIKDIRKSLPKQLHKSLKNKAIFFIFRIVEINPSLAYKILKNKIEKNKKQKYANR